MNKRVNESELAGMRAAEQEPFTTGEKSCDQLIELGNRGMALGDREMDAHHREFLTLAEQAASAPGAELAPALRQLVEHTREHFGDEENRMQSVNHPQLPEHRAEHQRILGDMERFYQRAEAGRGTMARAWVRENLLDWFSLHVRTMDSAIADEEKRS